MKMEKQSNKQVLALPTLALLMLDNHPTRRSHDHQSRVDALEMINLASDGLKSDTFASKTFGM